METVDKLRDRLIAYKMAFAAVELLSKGIGNRVVGLKDNKIVNYDIFDALNMSKSFDRETYDLSNKYHFHLIRSTIDRIIKSRYNTLNSIL